MVDVGYGGCKPRIKGIDKCQYRFCTILGIIKIIKRGEWEGSGWGGGVRVGGVRGDVNGEVKLL